MRGYFLTMTMRSVRTVIYFETERRNGYCISEIFYTLTLTVNADRNVTCDSLVHLEYINHIDVWIKRFYVMWFLPIKC